MQRITLVFLLLPSLVCGQGQALPTVEEALGAETVGTWSIIARDPRNGQIGIAVQSRAFRAGRTVPYAEPGVGLVATQAGAANTNYGKKAMAWLKEGMTPQAIVDRLVAEDPNPGSRQVAVIDNTGQIAVYTGPNCRNWAGHIIGDQWSAQGNILDGPQVVEETAKAFQASAGSDMDFADRLLSALEAGQKVGGDARGMQAGAVWVIEAQPDPDGSERYRGIDIRVDDHKNPFQELRRILNMVYSRQYSRLATRLANENNLNEAIEAQTRAIELNPTRDQLVYNLAALYARAGNRTNALQSLERAVQMHPRWKQEAAGDAVFESLRNDPDFQSLISE